VKYFTSGQGGDGAVEAVKELVVAVDNDPVVRGDGGAAVLSERAKDLVHPLTGAPHHVGQRFLGNAHGDEGIAVLLPHAILAGIDADEAADSSADVFPGEAVVLFRGEPKPARHNAREVAAESQGGALGPDEFLARHPQQRALFFRNHRGGVGLVVDQADFAQRFSGTSQSDHHRARLLTQPTDAHRASTQEIESLRAVTLPKQEFPCSAGNRRQELPRPRQVVPVAPPEQRVPAQLLQSDPIIGRHYAPPLWDLDFNSRTRARLPSVSHLAGSLGQRRWRLVLSHQQQHSQPHQHGVHQHTQPGEVDLLLLAAHAEGAAHYDEGNRGEWWRPPIGVFVSRRIERTRNNPDPIGVRAGNLP